MVRRKGNPEFCGGVGALNELIRLRLVDKVGEISRRVVDQVMKLDNLVGVEC